MPVPKSPTSGTACTTAAWYINVLDDHYRRYPGVRPDLGDLAVAAAELDGHPLAARPERIRQAAAEIQARYPNPDPEDVLLWAEARGYDAP